MCTKTRYFLLSGWEAEKLISSLCQSLFLQCIKTSNINQSQRMDKSSQGGIHFEGVFISAHGCDSLVSSGRL